MSEKALTPVERLQKIKEGLTIAYNAAVSSAPPAAPAPAEPPAPVAYEGALITGEIIRATPSLAEGSVLSIVSESGDIPAPDGTHQLADGTTVEVMNGSGQISSVTLPTPAAPAPPMVGMSAEEKAEFSELKSEFEKTKTVIINLDSSGIVDKLKEFEAKFSQMENLLKLSVEGFMALAEVPAVEPTKKPATEKVELSGEERAEDYFKRIKNLTKNKSLTIKK